MRKRIYAFLTVMILIIALFSPVTGTYSEAATAKKTVTSVKVGTKVTVGNINYKVTKLSKTSGEVSVTGVKKKTASLSIPASFKLIVKSGKWRGTHTINVTSIGKKAFADNMKLKKLTIGANVKTIGERAFYKTMNLRTVTLGKNVTTISQYAFSLDYNLRTVTIPSGSALKTIGKYAFKSCIKLNYFNFSNAKKLTTIGTGAFSDRKSVV